MAFWYFLLSFFINWLFFKFFAKFIPAFLLDIPNSRSSHIKPKPKAGGLIFVTSSVIFALFQKYNLILYCIPLAIVGFLDDIFSLPRICRYFTQVFTAFIILLNSTKLQLLITNYSSLNSSLILLFFVVLITAFINFSNFMDGLDGILASNFVVCFFVMALTFNTFLYPLIGALLGFLIWNWYPSKIFMGDVGSTFLGTIFISTVIDAPTIDQCFGLLLIGTPIFADALFCVVRRLISGQNIFNSHKLHLYQRLNQAGLSHSQVAIIYLLCTIFLSFIYLIFNIFVLIFCSILILIFGFWLDKNVAKAFY